MANISSAMGTLEFLGNWSPKLKEEFVAVINTYFSPGYGDYGMEIIPHDDYKEVNTVSFSGIGRWSFESILSRFSTWLHNSYRNTNKPANLQLSNNEASANNILSIKDFKEAGYLSEDVVSIAKNMKEQGLNVRVTFVDEEAGFDILYEQEGLITPKCLSDSDEAYSLEYTESCTTTYDYTRENLINLDVYDEFEIYSDHVLARIKELSQMATFPIITEAVIDDYLNDRPFIQEDNIDDLIYQMADAMVN